ncbi:uncharacterized mitochondrial protein-like protein [Tanacetum coccineum]
MTNDNTITPNHPLYLHQIDHPGLILISKKLTGSDNYGSWRRSMMIALNVKNKYIITIGEYPKPVKTLNCAVEVYYQKLKGFWDELDALEAPHLCNCLCNCENGRENIERDQRKRLIQFLMGLDEGYSNIRGQILLMYPLPTVVKAYGMVRHEEKKREGIFKEGHTKAECNKILGYPIGHPLYGKFPAKQTLKSTNDSRNYKLLTCGSTSEPIESSSLAVAEQQGILHWTRIRRLLLAAFLMASKDLRWVEVMTKEIQALEANKTWELTTLPPHKLPIRRKWVYRIKYNADSSIERFKARLVAKGFHQKEGVDYKETFAPVAKMVTVTDLLATSNNQSLINSIKQQLHETFSIEDLGPLHYYLGIEILINSTGITMSQRKYALELLQSGHVLNDKLAITPIDPQNLLNDTAWTPFPDPSHYRTLVGKLIYLTITRLDISFTAQLLSQFLHSPRTTHMKALLKVLRYIKLYPGQGLYFTPTSNPQLQAYYDIDWAACPITRRSITGSAIFLGKCLILWSLKKQSVVSRSLTEAEYRALADCTCKITWLKCLLKDLHINLTNPITIYRDNASTITLASNPIQHARTKHIELDCHFVRDKIREGSISPTFIPSRLQAADVLTKGLCKVLHYICIFKFGICDPYTLPTYRGGV